MVNIKNIIITSCGIRNDEFKNMFYQIVDKNKTKEMKLLYVTTASDGERDDNKAWMEVEYKTILDLGILEENIVEYKIGYSKDNIYDFDIMYMMGGNTFYLLDMIRKYNFEKEIKNYISKGKIYIGSSAGSEILGNSIDVALGYDENNVGMTDFTGLRIVDGLIVPHCNKKEEFVNNLKNKSKEKLYLLYDGDGVIYEE